MKTSNAAITSGSARALGLLDHLIRPLQEQRRDRQAEGLTVWTLTLKCVRSACPMGRIKAR